MINRTSVLKDIFGPLFQFHSLSLTSFITHRVGRKWKSLSIILIKV